MHPVILTRRIWKDDIRRLCGSKASWHLFTGEEKPHPGNLPWPGIEPGPAAWQARMLLPPPQRWIMKRVKETIEILSVNTILFIYRRCQHDCHQLRYVLCTAWLCHAELLERFPANHRWLQLLLVFVPHDAVSPRESRIPGFSCTLRNGNPMMSAQVSEGSRLLGHHV